jgi:hypothetical protein
MLGLKKTLEIMAFQNRKQTEEVQRFAHPGDIRGVLSVSCLITPRECPTGWYFVIIFKLKAFMGPPNV